MAPPRKIPSEEWNRHKAAILRLRNEEKLPVKGSNTNERSIMQVMQEEYNFHATKYQFEAQIKLWGAAKNLKKHDWEAILPVYDTLQLQGKQPRVRVGDYVFEESKVKRARREYGKQRDGTRGMLSQPGSSSDQIPLWHIEALEENGQYAEYCGTSEQTPAPEGLPVSNIIQSDLQDDILDDILGISIPTPTTNAVWAQNAMPGENTPYDELRYIFPWFDSPRNNAENTDDSIGSFLRQYLPTHTLLDDYNMGGALSTRGNNAWTPVDSSIPPSLGPPTMLFSDEVRSILSSMPQPLLRHSCDSTRSLSFVTDRLSSLPSASFLGQGSMEEINIVPRARGPLNMQELCARVLYSLVNNLAGLEDLEPSAICRMLTLSPTMKYHLHQGLQSENSFIAKALAINLLLVAADAGEKELVDFILKTTSGRINEIGINTIFSSTKTWDNFTALSLATRHASVGIVKNLLAHGAKECVLVKGQHGSERFVSALDEVVKIRDRGNAPVGKELLQISKLLISHEPRRTLTFFAKYLKDMCRNGTPPEYDVSGAQKQALSEVAETLFESIPKERYSELLVYKFKSEFSEIGEGVPILRLMVKVLEQRVAYKMVKTLLAAHDSTNSEASYLREYCHLLKETLLQAILENNNELLDHLLEHTKADDMHLIAAIRSGRSELISSILQSGICATGRVECSRHAGYELSVPGSTCCYVFSLRESEECIPTTPLAEAIRLKSPVLIDRLENYGALDKINDKQSLHFDAAALAIGEAGNFSYLERLLNLGPSLSLWTSLQTIESAVQRGLFNLAWTLIIRSPISDNYMGTSQEEAILCAIVRTGNLQFLEKVLECWNCFETDAINTLLVTAIDVEESQIVEYLLQLGVAYSPYNRIVPEVAITGHKIEVVMMFLELGALPGGGEGLRSAVEAADETIVHLLLDFGADPANEDAFCQALRIQSQSMLSILIGHFSAQYPNGIKGFGGTALVEACLLDDISTLDILLKAKFDAKHHVDAILPSVIEIFKGRNRVLLQMLHRLVDAGADPEAILSRRDNQSRTALLEAIKVNNLPVVKLLLSRGANINRLPRQGLKRTPLQQACEQGDFCIVEFMLEEGADINAPPAMNGGATALQLAAIQGNIRIVKLLLARGATIHEAPGLLNGRTALQGAAEHGRLSVLDLLLVQGAAGYRLEDIEDAKGYAEKEGHQGCVGRLNLACTRLGTNAIM